jgi:hypothetical protein
MAPNSLAALAALERRFDGPIPTNLRLVARHGSAAAVELLFATGQAAFFRHLVRNHIEAIRRRRATGGDVVDLAADLALYRRQWRCWQRMARQLRRDVLGAD